MSSAPGHAQFWVKRTQILERSITFSKGYSSSFKLTNVGSALRLVRFLVGVADDFFQICGSAFRQDIMSFQTRSPGFKTASAITVKLRASTSPASASAIRCLRSVCSSMRARSSSGPGERKLLNGVFLHRLTLQGRESLQALMLLVCDVDGQSAHFAFSAV